MNINKSFYTAVSGLFAAAPLYPVVAPLDAPDTFLNYQRNNSESVYTFSGKSKLAVADFALDSYSKSYSTAQTNADTAQSYLDGFVGTLGTHRVHKIELTNRLDLFEEDTELHRVSLNFTIWYDEE